MLVGVEVNAVIADKTYDSNASAKQSRPPA
jgi:hypothetical protein